jgi:hypothetical protein
MIMTFKKRILIPLALALTLCVALTGCMFGNQPVAPEGSPLASGLPDGSMAPQGTGLTPQGTPGAQVSGAPAPGNTEVKEPFDWRAKAATVEARINMFSEIAESRIVTYGTTALVGVKFTSQYKGELTQRIRDMIAGEVMAADNSIQVVAVTAEPTDVNTIFSLSDQLKSGADSASLQTEVERISRNATTLR